MTGKCPNIWFKTCYPVALLLQTLKCCHICYVQEHTMITFNSSHWAFKHQTICMWSLCHHSFTTAHSVRTLNPFGRATTWCHHLLMEVSPESSKLSPISASHVTGDLLFVNLGGWPTSSVHVSVLLYEQVSVVHVCNPRLPSAYRVNIHESYDLKSTDKELN